MKEKISFDDFQKLDLHIGTVLEAERVEGSEKLLKLIIDLGEEKRQIVAGLAKVIEDPADLVGKQLPIIVNLEPKKLMGVESQGMILAANNEGTPVLLHPNTEVPPGSKIT